MEDEDQDMLETFADGDENEAHVRDSTKTKGNRKAKGIRLKAFDVSRPDLVSAEEDTDEEDLELTESDGDGEGGHRFKSFRDQDMQNPAFQLDLCFLRLRNLEKPSMSKCHE